VHEVSRAVRRNRTVSVVMLELDHFKNFNDTFGHQAGDALLRQIAGVLKARIRAADVACRLGGEEFALILSEVNAVGAVTCVEVPRQEIKHLSLEFRNQSLNSVTISAGLPSSPPTGARRRTCFTLPTWRSIAPRKAAAIASPSANTRSPSDNVRYTRLPSIRKLD
jgi:diguanylate cyclase (GGDEF)-like protein